MPRAVNFWYIMGPARHGLLRGFVNWAAFRREDAVSLRNR
jgi:hypothetical protein